MEPRSPSAAAGRDACPRCGAAFYCGRSERECWCAGLPALAPVPGRSCLCRDCLEEELKERT